MSESFPKHNRLRVRPDFVRVQRHGERVHLRHVLAVFKRSRDGVDQPSRFGLTVSKKVGNAVVRNRVKRGLREGLRRSTAHGCPLHRLAGIDVVLIARGSAADLSSEQLADQARLAVDRVIAAAPDRAT